MTEGLRERKKQRTREAIIDAAMRLFAERGFDHTTIADIAAEADIAPRTFFAYFPAKEDVVFADIAERFSDFRARLLDRREPGETALDALRSWIDELITTVGLAEKRHECRQDLIAANPAIAARDRHLHAQFTAVLTEAVAADLGEEPGALRPRMVAAAASAALETLSQHADPTTAHAKPLSVLDEALVFLRGGVEALQATDAAI
ncbi:MAG TPA: TetR family transcriptional regulator [Solirubrobacteraceae bacterium]|nr:TetR family transcriptional regulator [Solirubrobacteraceae bacterium]